MAQVFKPRSLRRLLAFQLIGSVAVLAAGLIFLFQTFSKQIAEESQDNILLASATSILDGISARDGAVVADIPYAALSMLGSVSDDRVFYRIDLGDETLTGYADLPTPAPNDKRAQFATAAFKGADVRTVSAARILSLGQRTHVVRVTVAQTQDGLDERLNALFWQATLIGLGFFLIASLLAIWVVNTVFRPIAGLAKSVSRRGPNDLRPFRMDVHEEMVALVSALNGFTERLSRSLSRSEDFITEAAHRVRTPLATVRTQAEVLLRHMQRDKNRAALKAMIRAIDESSRAAGQLLDQAMVTLRTDALERQEVDLSECISDVVERLRPVADLRDIRLLASFEGDVIVRADAILLQNAVTNLLDNAIKYAPQETDVSVTVSVEATEAVVRITDQGQGFTPNEQTSLLERFVRGSAAVGTVGSGLGLTIAQEVFAAHDGRLVLGNQSKGTGACVEAYLPQ